MRETYYEEYFRVEDRHWWFVARRRILLALLDRYLGAHADGRRILDLGCGTGGLLERLSRYGDVQGVDADPAAVSFCRARGLTNVSQTTIPPLPFGDGEFDVVTAFDFVEHVEDDERTVAEVRRVLTPGGTFFVTVPAFGFLWGEHDEISHHHRRYSARSLHSLLAAGGLRPRRVTYFNTLLFPPIAAMRLGRRALARRAREPRSDLAATGEGGVANRVLTRVFAAEAPLLLRRDLPFGVSLFAVADAP